jgi:capsular polysaccharide transport system permease protein
MIAKLFKLDHSFSPDGGPAPADEKKKRMEVPYLRGASRGRILFALTVVLPTILAILYYGFIASNVYVSESQFVVRSPDKPTTSGLGVILKTAGFSNANDEIYSAQSYVLSRDALRAINRNDAFRVAYTRPSISVFDRFNPTGMFGSFEDLYLYYQKKIGIEHDTVSAISTLRVRAYTPQDAAKFNRELLEMAESTVNRLNVRGRQDLIRFAQAEVDEAEGKSRNAAMNLARFRNVSGVVDPERQATVQLQMISKLQDELIASRNQLMQLRAFAPANPQVPVLRTKIAGLTRDIEAELNKVAGGSRSLSAAAAQYQRYQLESEVADKQLAGAISALQEARNEARRKQAYVERIAQPNLPDAAVEPRRLRGIIATFIFGLIAYGIVSMLLAGIREHHD